MTNEQKQNTAQLRWAALAVFWMQSRWQMKENIAWGKIRAEGVSRRNSAVTRTLVHFPTKSSFKRNLTEPTPSLT